MSRVAATGVEELRRSFDESFARAPDPPEGEAEELIAIRVAGDPFALRLTELAGVHAQRKITPLPGGAPALLGVSGVRGHVTAVYDVARILGYQGAEHHPRWLAVCRADAAIALSLAEVEGYLRVRASELRARERDDGVVLASFEQGSVVRGLLSVPGLIASIRRGSDAAGATR